MGVVEVEHVGADAVDERGVERVHPLGAAEQGGAARLRERRERGDGVADGLLRRTADGTATQLRSVRFAS